MKYFIFILCLFIFDTSNAKESHFINDTHGFSKCHVGYSGVINDTKGITYSEYHCFEKSYILLEEIIKVENSEPLFKILDFKEVPKPGYIMFIGSNENTTCSIKGKNVSENMYIFVASLDEYAKKGTIILDPQDYPFEYTEYKKFIMKLRIDFNTKKLVDDLNVNASCKYILDEE